MISPYLNIEMGTWDKAEEIPDSQNRPRVTSVYVGEEFVNQSSFLCDRFSIQPQVIYYPCSGTDISPTVAFPRVRVIFADLNEASMAALREKGFEAHTASALDFDPKLFDLLVLMNPQVPSAPLASRLSKGGHVICNH